MAGVVTDRRRNWCNISVLDTSSKTKQNKKNNKENGCSFSGLLQTVCGLKGGSGEAGDCGQEDAMTGREERGVNSVTETRREMKVF